MADVTKGSSRFLSIDKTAASYFASLGSKSWSELTESIIDSPKKRDDPEGVDVYPMTESSTAEPRSVLDRPSKKTRVDP